MSFWEIQNNGEVSSLEIDSPGCLQSTIDEIFDLFDYDMIILKNSRLESSLGIKEVFPE